MGSQKKWGLLRQTKLNQQYIIIKLSEEMECADRMNKIPKQILCYQLRWQRSINWMPNEEMGGKYEIVTWGGEGGGGRHTHS